MLAEAISFECKFPGMEPTLVAASDVHRLSVTWDMVTLLKINFKSAKKHINTLGKIHLVLRTK
jgi:hypothetical protein